MSNLLLVDRLDPNLDGVRSVIYLAEREVARAIEPTWRPPGQYVQGKTAIPAGRYPLGFRWSPSMSKEYYTLDGINLLPASTYKKWPESAQEAWLAKYKPKDPKTWAKLKEADKLRQLEHMMIHVQNIGRESNVYFHWGNFAMDSKACCIVGAAWAKISGRTAVNNSRAKYVAFYKLVAPLVRAGGRTATFRDSFEVAEATDLLA
jgi:hypothetical protein